MLLMNKWHIGINNGEAQYHNTEGVISSIPGALVTSKLERSSYTSVVDVSIRDEHNMLLKYYSF